MEITKTLEVNNRAEWRKWLKENHQKEKEIWLVYYRKNSGKPRLPYNDAVEEALCFGWIDSTQKKLDEERLAQRYTPRKAKSELSQMNKERIRSLIKSKKMTKAGLKAVEHLFDSNEKFKIPTEIINELKKNKAAWKNFQDFPESYKRIRIAYIESGKRHGQTEYEKRLNNFLKMTALNKKFGMMK